MNQQYSIRTLLAEALALRPPHVLSCRRPVTENKPQLVSMWHNLIDWNGRRQGENGFLIRALPQPGFTRIFESALGDACDAIYLMENGYKVWANERDPIFRSKAKENIEVTQFRLESLTASNWLTISNDPKLKDFAGTFDAVLCLGNSLTYIFNRNEQIQALRQLRSLLRPGGRLIIDSRNYQYWLDERQDLLVHPERNRYKHRIVYVAERVRAYPVYIQDDEVVIEYHDHDRHWGRLHLYPFKCGELLRVIREAGFESISEFSDYREGFSQDADFHQYVCHNLESQKEPVLTSVAGCLRP